MKIVDAPLPIPVIPEGGARPDGPPTGATERQVREVHLLLRGMHVARGELVRKIHAISGEETRVPGDNGEAIHKVPAASDQSVAVAMVVTGAQEQLEVSPRARMVRLARLPQQRPRSEIAR